MSSPEKDELFDLIQSLTKAEKRYFKVFFSNHVIGEKNNYMKLYDFMASQQEYNPAKLQRKFKGEKFLKYYSKTKTYLTELIFRGLRSFHSGKNPKDIIFEKLQNLRLLNKKNLSDQIPRQLARLKKYCRETEEFNLLLEVLEFEHWLAYDQSMVRQSVWEERLEVIRIIENYMEYGNLYGKLLEIVIREDNQVGEERSQIIEEIMEDPLVSDIKNALCLTAQFSYYSLHTLHSHIQADYASCCIYKSKAIDIYENNPVYLKSNSKSYLLALGNLVTMYYNNRDYKGLSENYARLLKAHASVKGFAGLKFEQKSMFGMLVHKVNKNYDAFDAVVADFNSEFHRFADAISLIKETDIYFNIGITYFELGRMSEALDWVNKILNHPKAESRQYLFIYTRTLELLIHSELDNQNLLHYKSDSTYKYLLNHGKLDDFSRSVLRFAREMSRKSDREGRLRAYDIFYKSLNKIPKKEYQRIANDQMDYLKWLEAKIPHFTGKTS